MPRARGQMEIMGLAIIVILISIGLLFAVQWMLKEPPTKQVQRAKEAVLTSNFLSSSLGVTTDCNQRTVGELLRDCALTGGVNKCGDQTACVKAEKVLKDLLSETLDVWGYDYYFAVKGSTHVENIKFNKPCPGEKESKSHPLPISAGFHASLILEICR